MDANTTTKAGYGQPALIGGLVMGVMSALPIINTLNLCCCLWIVTGGLVAAYLLQQNQAMPLTAGDGAVVGLLAGLIGAVVTLVISIPIGMLVEPLQRQLLQQVLSQGGNLSPALRGILESYAQPRTDVGFVGAMIVRVIGLCILLFAGSIFSTLGGLLGVALFRKRLPPPAVSDEPIQR